MIETINVDTMEGVMRLIADQTFNEKIGRLRSSYLYRGVPSDDYALVTSLRRNCKDRFVQLEPFILRNFSKYASIDDPTLNRSVWRQMILGRHHGLPTRLLDWSHSPLIGLHFATTESDLDMLAQRDGVVWRIDVRALNQNLPDAYRRTLEEHDIYIFPVDRLTELAGTLKKYDEDMGDRAFAVIEPPSIDQRIINQYSFFSVMPSGVNDIEKLLADSPARTVKYVIDRKLRWDVRDLLDQMNMSERIIYPGLDGLSSWISRHYFVK